MSAKKKLKMTIDLVMTILLPLLMSYSRIGETNHEVLGILMMAVFVLHQVMNVQWYRNLFKGKYGIVRILMSVINASILVLMCGQLICGILLSKSLFKIQFAVLNITTIRLIHLSFPYWLYVMLAIHLGFHGGMILGLLKRTSLYQKRWLNRILTSMVLLISGYGVYAFIKRQFPDYMFLLLEYAFFDFNESYIFFFLDYLAVMVLFVTVGFYLMKLVVKVNRYKNHGKNN